MKSFSKLFVSLALCAMASLSMAATAASAPKSGTENETANTMGIITPDVATSVVVFDYFTRFRDTGDFAICSDGSDQQICEPKTYLTPEKYVAKFLPKGAVYWLPAPHEQHKRQRYLPVPLPEKETAVTGHDRPKSRLLIPT